MLALPQTQQEEHHCSIQKHRCEHLDDKRYEVFGLCLVLLLISHVLDDHPEEVIHPVYQERYRYCSAVGDAFMQEVIACAFLTLGEDLLPDLNDRNHRKNNDQNNEKG